MTFRLHLIILIHSSIYSLTSTPYQLLGLDRAIWRLLLWATFERFPLCSTSGSWRHNLVEAIHWVFSGLKQILDNIFSYLLVKRKKKLLSWRGCGNISPSINQSSFLLFPSLNLKISIPFQNSISNLIVLFICFHFFFFLSFYCYVL